MRKFKAQVIAGMVWAFGTMETTGARVFAVLAGVAAQIVDFKAQELANAAWAFATVA